jgi:cold shock protein
MNAPIMNVTTPLDSGRIKWFSANKGYGFIIPDDGGNDVFLHITIAQQCGSPSLPNGARVRYRAEVRPKGVVATFVEVTT